MEIFESFFSKADSILITFVSCCTTKSLFPSPLDSFKNIFSNFLALCLLTISLGFGDFSGPKHQESHKESSWTESIGFPDHGDIAQPTYKVFQSQIESFKFPVDQFCFLGFPIPALLSEPNSLTVSWWKLRIVFFDISRVLYPFHFFW